MNNITKILYVSCACSKKTEDSIFRNNSGIIGLQIQKYHRLLLRGFAKNGLDVCALSYQPGAEILPFGQETEDSIVFKYVRTKKKMIGHLIVLFKSFFMAKSYFKSNPNCAAFFDVLSISNCLGAILAAKIHRIPAIGIITDFPEQLSSSNRLFSFFSWRIISLCRGYVVMTPHMLEKLKRKRKSVVLEGHVDAEISHKKSPFRPKDQTKKCVYAGTLHEKYGIKKLVDAFLLANIDDAELHIFGDGDSASWIKYKANGKIVFHGIVANDVVCEFEKNATVLVNPRPSNEEFTKYSFPSKNMEYMASGTPVITTILPGMPKEYYKYVFLFEDESVKGMANTLKDVLNKSPVELQNKGLEAQKFVFEQKNNIIQAKKIIDAFFHQS